MTSDRPVAAGVTLDLSIIIVNWNSCSFLQKCLESIRQNASGLAYEVIVVDNASFDGSRALVESQFPRVVFIQSDANLGFARANNLGFASSSGRHVLFLNPDTEIVGSALQAMVACADANPSAGIVGARLLNSDLTVQMESIRAFPCLLNQVLESHLLKSRFPRWSIWGMRPLFDNTQEPAVVDAVSGACLLIKRNLFERVSQFSTQYFMYSEDVDLCYKAREAGSAVYLVNQAQVIHHGGRSSALRPVSQFAAVLIRESRFQFLRLSRGPVYALAYRGVTAMIATGRLALLLVLFPFLTILRDASPVSTMGKWMKILQWSLGFAPWVKTL